MADITMCIGEKDGKDCPLKETCYRYKAKPNEFWQSYFMEPPYNELEEKCYHYWKIEE